MTLKQKYLVTGVAGFIGSAVAKRFIAEGHEVLGLDNLRTGSLESIPPGVVFIQGDCQNQKLVESFVDKDLDGIFHIAGQSSGEISFDDPVDDLQTNTQSTLLLLDLARKISCPQFVYASTMSVYGVQPDAPVHEDATTHPESFYGVGKLASEEYMRIYSKFGIATTALRLFNVYGPGQNLLNLRQGMISIYLAQALRKGQILVKGAPGRFRDFVYIDDVVEAFSQARFRKEKAWLICNICTGERTTVEQVLSGLRSAMNADISVKFEGSTPGDVFGIVGANDRARKILGWTPQTDLHSGLERMVQWARALPQ